MTPTATKRILRILASQICSFASFRATAWRRLEMVPGPRSHSKPGSALPAAATRRTLWGVIGRCQASRRKSNLKYPEYQPIRGICGACGLKKGPKGAWNE